MQKNDRLATNVITPTTKSDEHDVPISPAEIVAKVCGGGALEGEGGVVAGWQDNSARAYRTACSG
jgi:phosphoribosylaminoimidazole-succinocarboxamide synthase